MTFLRKNKTIFMRRLNNTRDPLYPTQCSYSRLIRNLNTQGPEENHFGVRKGGTSVILLAVSVSMLVFLILS